MKEKNFLQLCRTTRRDLVEMFIASGGGHLASALSVVEILVTLFDFEMRTTTRGAAESERDRFILSKGHASLALYSVLARHEYFSAPEPIRVGRPGSPFGGHPTSGKVSGIEISTGSLGLSPSVAVGIALSARLKGLSYRTFCLLGDGECNEGSVWEAAMSAAQKHLNRLFFLVDCNGYQAFGKTSDICDLEPFTDKWRAFGFDTHDIDLREDPLSLLRLFGSERLCSDRPTAILCRTSKGMGIREIENDPRWHNKNKLTPEETALLRAAVMI